MMPRNRITTRFLDEAEGEGFEPSIHQKTDNGFRDPYESLNLQGFCCSFASLFARLRQSPERAFAELTTPGWVRGERVGPRS
jgi:hypothetical protein